MFDRTVKSPYKLTDVSTSTDVTPYKSRPVQEEPPEMIIEEPLASKRKSYKKKKVAKI